MFGHHANEFDGPDEFIRDEFGWVIGEGDELYDASSLCWHDLDDDPGPCDPIDEDDEDGPCGLFDLDPAEADAIFAGALAEQAAALGWAPRSMDSLHAEHLARTVWAADRGPA